MASIGEVVENKAMGERVVFVALAADTSGALFAYDAYMAPGGSAPGAHIHPQQEERFEIVDGSLRFRIGKDVRVATAGEVVTIPAGTAHFPVNAGDAEARFRVEFRPALNMETFFENAFAMLSARGPRRTVPMILEFSELLSHYHDEVALSPAGLRLLATLAAPIGRAVG